MKFSVSMHHSTFGVGIFGELIRECGVYAYVRKNHQLCKKKKLSLDILAKYPCLLFEQDQNSSAFFYEEMIEGLQNHENVIKTCDRASTFELMKKTDAYAIGVGIVPKNLNGEDWVAIPLDTKEKMKIVYLKKNNVELSEMAKIFIERLKSYDT